MPTFISTTLAKRTGATNTVFSPLGIDGSVGTLADVTAANQRLGSSLTMSQKRGNARRTTTVRVFVPLVDTSGSIPVLKSVATAELSIVVPDGTPTANVNDLVGYLEKVCASATTNFNSLLVNGEGVW